MPFEIKKLPFKKLFGIIILIREQDSQSNTRFILVFVEIFLELFASSVEARWWLSYFSVLFVLLGHQRMDGRQVFLTVGLLPQVIIIM